MSSPDPERTPVLVAGAQLLQRDVPPAEALSPSGMLERVARGLADDAGVPERALGEVDTIAVVAGLGVTSRNPARALAGALGARPAREMLTATGGEMAVHAVDHFACEIRRGAVRSVLLAGAHNLRTLRRARKEGVALEKAAEPNGEPQLFGENRPGNTDEEKAYGLDRPSSVYPLFENALRARRGLDLETHRERMGALMSRFTRVAESNPQAWFPVFRSPEEITTPTASNRMVAFPYTKYLNAVMETDQAAGVWMMSAAAARAYGIPEERWIHPWGGGAAAEQAWFPSERPDFADCPALARAVRCALARSGVELGEIGAFDFYSCFPVAVEMACWLLGLAEDDPRGLTVTGGLPYAGGPGNNYTLHALAAMLERLRGAPGTLGLVTGNGWYLTKHSAIVLSSAPPPAAGAPAAVPEPEDAPAVTVHPRVSGPAHVVTYTVLYGRDGAPVRGIVIGRAGSGERFLANLPDDRGLLEAFVARERVGTAGRVASVEGRHRFEPA